MSKLLSEEVKAEAGFVIPKLRATKYPWKTMKVGESFPFSNGSHAWSYVCGANRKYKPKRFRPGKLADGTMRIWRIE